MQLAQSALTARFDREHAGIEQRCHTALAGLLSELEEGESKAQGAAKEARWLAQSVFDAAQVRLARQAEEVAKQLGGVSEQLNGFELAAAQHLVACRLNLPEAPEPEAVEIGQPAEPGAALAEAIAAAEVKLHELFSLPTLRLFQGAGMAWLTAACALVVFGLVGVAVGWQPGLWIGLGTAGFAAVAPAVLGGLWWLARGQATEAYRKFREQAAHTAALAALCRAKSDELDRRQRAAIEDQRKIEVDRTERALNVSLANFRRHREQETRRLTSDAGTKLTRLQQTFEQELERAIAQHAQQQTAARELHDRESEALGAEHAQALAEAAARRGEAQTAGRAAWRQGFASRRRTGRGAASGGTCGSGLGLAGLVRLDPAAHRRRRGAFRRADARPAQAPGRDRPGRGPEPAELAGGLAVSRRRLGLRAGNAGGPPPGDRVFASADAADADRRSRRQGAVHDRRPGRAWGRILPPSCTWPISTRRWSATGSGRSRNRSSSGWPT